MKVRINDLLCQGHGMCTLLCSEVFQLNDEDAHAYVVSEVVPAQFESAADNARRSCPEQAIEIF